MVAREIVHDISGRPPMSKLAPEAEMLAKYGVGRASLREALRLLEVQGLIVIRSGPGGGPVVAPVETRNYARTTSLFFYLSGATYRDIVEARLALEPVMARLGAARKAADIAALERFVSDEPEPTHDAEHLRRSTEFHGLLSGMSGNPVLDFMGRALDEIHMNRVSDMAFSLEERSRVEHDHSEIAQAIIDSDADRAEALTREHMVAYVEYCEQHHPGVLDQVVDWR